MKAPQLKVNTVTQFPVSLVQADPQNPRTDFDQKALAELSQSIAESGVLIPLRVRKDGSSIVLVDGERRLRAAKLARLKTVPVLLAASEDAAERRITQVVINNQRANLKPLEIAQFLVKLKDEEKLTPNEIAATLEKRGMKAMSRSQVANMIRLVDLPAFAKKMVDAGELEITAARGILTAKDHPLVLKSLERRIAQQIKWAGRATVEEVEESIVDAFEDNAILLTKTYGTSPVRFDYKTVCKGCEHLKEYGGHAWCLSAEGFNTHQAQAIEAGLGAGGEKPKKERDQALTPAQAKKAEAAKVEKREQQLERNAQTYLHEWCRARLRASWPEYVGTHRVLRDWVALGEPGPWSGEMSGLSGRLRKVAIKHGMVSLSAMLKSPKVGRAENVGYELEMSLAVLEALPWPEVRWIAQHTYGHSLAHIWKVDADYLGLLRKAELVAIAETHCTLPEGRRAWSALKLDELVAAILEKADTIPPPPELSALYEADDPDRMVFGAKPNEYLDDEDDGIEVDEYIDGEEIELDGDDAPTAEGDDE